jgi:DNA-binding MarR family transcriptional regulator
MTVMILTENNASILEHPYSIQLLLLLRKNFPMPVVELQRQMKVNRSTLERRIDELSSAGIVKIQMLKNMKRRVIVSLTPFGREVANQLRLINGLEPPRSAKELAD